MTSSNTRHAEKHFGIMPQNKHRGKKTRNKHKSSCSFADGVLMPNDIGEIMAQDVGQLMLEDNGQDSTVHQHSTAHYHDNNVTDDPSSWESQMLDYPHDLK
jgi:hypothetical protein